MVQVKLSVVFILVVAAIAPAVALPLPAKRDLLGKVLGRKPEPPAKPPVAIRVTVATGTWVPPGQQHQQHHQPPENKETHPNTGPSLPPLLPRRRPPSVDTQHQQNPTSDISHKGQGVYKPLPAPPNHGPPSVDTQHQQDPASDISHKGKGVYKPLPAPPNHGPPSVPVEITTTQPQQHQQHSTPGDSHKGKDEIRRLPPLPPMANPSHRPPSENKETHLTFKPVPVHPLQVRKKNPSEHALAVVHPPGPPKLTLHIPGESSKSNPASAAGSVDTMYTDRTSGPPRRGDTPIQPGSELQYDPNVHSPRFKALIEQFNNPGKKRER